MIVGGCLGMGLWYKQFFVGRLEALRNLQRILEMLISEIRYGKATLPECCGQIAGRLQEPYGNCFGQIYNRMAENTGVMFGQVFREEMEGCMKGLPLLQEDKNYFLDLFSENGFGDENMQIRSIEQCREMMMGVSKRLERENTEKCRMAVGLGAMSGLLLVIILV